MNLSERLLLMAQNVTKCETMADIGTDHGFLAFYLIEENLCNKAILADISRGSLDKAEANVRQFIDYMGDETVRERFSFRLGNGISVLEPGEADVVCIAGMGGALIAAILEADLKKARTFKKYILQPRNGQAKLRRWLEIHNFVTEKNLLVREGKFICEVIVASPGKEASILPSRFVSDLPYEFPEDLFLHNEALATEFAAWKLNLDLTILESIGDRDPARSRRVSAHAQYFKELLEKRKSDGTRR